MRAESRSFAQDNPWCTRVVEELLVVSRDEHSYVESAHCTTNVQFCIVAFTSTTGSCPS